MPDFSLGDLPLRFSGEIFSCDCAEHEPSPIRDAQFSIDIMQVNLHRAFSYPE